MGAMAAGALDEAAAARLARVISDNLGRNYPYKPGHVHGGDHDARPPRELTPIFCGCFDWHSAVHSHWAAARLVRAFPTAPWAQALADAIGARLTATDVAAEKRFLDAPERRGFEVPYGMAWLLTLARELERHDRWRGSLAPLEATAARRMDDWLARLPGPVRSGEHSQSALAMALWRDWADDTGDADARATIDRRAREFYLGDRDAPLAYEPSAYDFVSPSLAEADLMARVLSPAELAPWIDGFLTGPLPPPPALTAVDDGKLAHAAGLAFSRAWMLRRIARALGPTHPRHAELVDSEQEHARNAQPTDETAGYAVAHWVGTFELYYLTAA